MLIFVSPIIFLSSVSFTVQQNAPTYPPTSRRTTHDGNHDTLDLSTTIIDRAYNTMDQTSNTNNSFHANEENTANSQNASKEKDFNRDVNRISVSVVSIKKWDEVDALLKLQTREMLENLNIKDAVTKANASDPCKSSLELYFNALSDLETWSVKMADATGKISGGVLEGRFMSFGSYEECLKVRVSSAEEGAEGFRGQYCLSKFRSPPLSSLYLKNGSLNRQYVETYGEPPPWIEDFILRMGPYLKYQVFSLGTCVPSTCSDQELTQVMTQIVSPIGMSVAVSGCQVEKPITWTKSLIAAVSVLSSIAILCILGSVIDITNRVSAKKVQEEDQSSHSEHAMMKLLKMFSVLSNIEIFVNTDSGGSFGCLGGIRFFSATWVVLYHTYLITSTWFFNKFSNAMAFKEDFSDSLPLAAIDNVSIAIVSFFFISGFLMSYFMWRKLEKGNGDLNFIKFFLHKYWRLTPCIVLTLAVFVVLVQTVSGPLWNVNMEHGMEMCHSNWWKTFLFIANWWKWDDICLIHTWFLSCLMQFHIIGFIIIQITFRWPAVGVLIGVVIVLGCCGLVVTVAVLKKISLPTTMAQKDFDMLQIWRSWFRYKPFYYMQSYAIGMLLGYLVLKHKGKKISQRYQAVGWILSLMGSAYAVYGIQGPENNPVFTGFYYAFSFFAWSASLGWFIYACIAGYGGIVNRFLSWKGFQLFGSISYLIYLLHVILIYYNNNAIKEVVHYGHYEMISSFLGTLVISTFLAFVGHVTVEMPFNHLEKLIF